MKTVYQVDITINISDNKEKELRITTNSLDALLLSLRGDYPTASSMVFVFSIPTEKTK